MNNYSFTTWINEYADFGLDMSRRPKGMEPEEDDDKPLTPLNVEYVIKFLKRRALGEKYAIPNDFFGELQWGNVDGAVQLHFSNFGGNRVVLRKLIHDLEGDPKWVCKKVMEVKNGYDLHPDKLIFEIQQNLEKIDGEGIDSPSRDYKDLQKFVIAMANEIRRKNTQKIFMYEGIRVVKEHYKYLVHWGVTGMGLQRRGQKRLDQFAIHCEYNEKSGLIKITGTPLGDKIDKHRWIYDPSNFIEYFSPYQKEEEIIGAVLTHFNCY